LTKISSGGVRRTINGDPVWIGRPSHRRYRLAVSGVDIRPLTTDALWEGMPCTVVPATRIIAGVPSGMSQVTLDRTPFDGSVVVHKLLNPTQSIGGWSLEGRLVSITDQVAEDLVVSYRPVLSMVVEEAPEVEKAEAKAQHTWRVTFVE
jgi:hypothetical protein